MVSLRSCIYVQLAFLLTLPLEDVTHPGRAPWPKKPLMMMESATCTSLNKTYWVTVVHAYRLLRWSGLMQNLGRRLLSNGTQGSWSVCASSKRRVRWVACHIHAGWFLTRCVCVCGCNWSHCCFHKQVTFDSQSWREHRLPSDNCR